MCKYSATLIRKFFSNVFIHSFKVEVDIFNQLILCTSGYEKEYGVMQNSETSSVLHATIFYSNNKVSMCNCLL